MNDIDQAKRELSILLNQVTLLSNATKSFSLVLKDGYYNDNSFYKNSTNLFVEGHPLKLYGTEMMSLMGKAFNDWQYNQQSNFDQLDRYVERVERVSSSSNSNNLQEINQLLNDKTDQFDVVLINIQLSFNSLLQCITNIHVNATSNSFKHSIPKWVPNNNSNGTNGTNGHINQPPPPARSNRMSWAPNNNNNTNVNQLNIQPIQPTPPNRKSGGIPPQPLNQPPVQSNDLPPKGCFKLPAVNRPPISKPPAGPPRQLNNSINSTPSAPNPLPPTTSVNRSSTNINNNQNTSTTPTPLPPSRPRSLTVGANEQLPAPPPRQSSPPIQSNSNSNIPVSKPPAMYGGQPTPFLSKPKPLNSINNNSVSAQQPTPPRQSSPPLNQPVSLNRPSQTNSNSTVNQQPYPYQPPQPIQPNQQYTPPLYSQPSNGNVSTTPSQSQPTQSNPSYNPPPPKPSPQPIQSSNNPPTSIRSALNSILTPMNQLTVKSRISSLPKYTTLSALQNDHETHKQLWDNKRWKLTRTFESSVRSTMTHRKGYNSGMISKWEFYQSVPPNLNNQIVKACGYELYCAHSQRHLASGEVIESESGHLFYRAIYEQKENGANQQVYAVDAVYTIEVDCYSIDMVEVTDGSATQMIDEELVQGSLMHQAALANVTPVVFDLPEFKEFIDREGLSHKIFADGTKESDLCLAYRVGLWIYANIKYVAGNTDGKTPLETVKYKQGDCGSHSFLFAGIIRYNGIPCRTVIGRTSKTDPSKSQEKHCKNQFYINGIGWVPYDGAYKDANPFHKERFGKDSSDYILFQDNIVWGLGFPQKSTSEGALHGSTFQNPSWRYFTTSQPPQGMYDEMLGYVVVPINDGNQMATPQYDEQTISSKLLVLVNQERAKVGAQPLTLHPALIKASKFHSDHQASTETMTHDDPNGDMMKRIQVMGWKQPLGVAENVAYGQKTEAEVMHSWMNSPGHKKNILNPIYNRFGAAVSPSSNNSLYWTQQFGKE